MIDGGLWGLKLIGDWKYVNQKIRGWIFLTKIFLLIEYHNFLKILCAQNIRVVFLRRIESKLGWPVTRVQRRFRHPERCETMKHGCSESCGR